MNVKREVRLFHSAFSAFPGFCSPRPDELLSQLYAYIQEELICCARCGAYAVLSMGGVCVFPDKRTSKPLCGAAAPDPSHRRAHPLIFILH